MLGSRVKTALDTTTRRSLRLSMPMAIPAFHARTMKNTLMMSTKRMMDPQMRYIGALLSLSRTDISKSSLWIFMQYSIP